MDENMKNKISNIVSSFSQLPYLFIGTGLSMRYSTAPSWDDLLKEIWKVINEGNEKEYKFFIRRVEHELGQDFDELDPDEKKYNLNPVIASKIRELFNNKFYEDNNFKNKIFIDDEIEIIIDNKYDPFKYFISKQIGTLKIKDDKIVQDETLCLKANQNKIAGIITTNYDSLLERIFPDFSAILGNESLLIANTENLFNIYKIHGSNQNPNTIVITKEDYDYFLGKLKYLSAKLLTLFVEHPIIFIGYSISDVNIRSILKEISICLSNEQLINLKNKFIFIKPAFGEAEGINNREIIFGNKRIIMTEIVLENYIDFYDSLSNIESSMPVRAIRKMQDMFCNFIATTEATNNIFVGNLNDPNIGEKVGIYFGPLETVSNIGFKTYSLNDIMEDILFDSKPYLINKSIIDETFKNIRSTSGQTYLPIYKYLAKLDLSIDYLPENYKIIIGDDGINLNTNEKKFCKDNLKLYFIKDVISKFPDHNAKQLANIQNNYDNFEIEDLGNYLREKFYDVNFREKLESQYRKIVALYDFKKYSKTKKV